MNFKSIKIYFLVILIAANLFLIFNLYINSRNDGRLEREVIEDTVLILSENRIGITSDIIPEAVISADIIECAFDTGYYERVAELIGKEKKESVNILPDSSVRVTLKSGDSFVFDSNFKTDYTSSAYDTSKDSDLADFMSDSAEALRKLKRTTLTDSEKRAAEFLITPKNEDEALKGFSYEFDAAYNFDGGKLAVFTQTLNGLAIRDHVMHVVIKNGEALRATGKWFYPLELVSYSSELYDQLSLLFKELQYKNNTYGKDIVDESNKNTYVYNIEKIDMAYCIYWKTGQDALFFIPTWKITTDEPAVRYYNALNCELYE